MGGGGVPKKETPLFVCLFIEIATRSADASGQSPTNKLVGLLTRGRRTNNAPLTSAAGCLKFGAGSKTSFCLGHIGLLTC